MYCTVALEEQSSPNVEREKNIYIKAAGRVKAVNVETETCQPSHYEKCIPTSSVADPVPFVKMITNHLTLVHCFYVR